MEKRSQSNASSGAPAGRNGSPGKASLTSMLANLESGPFADRSPETPAARTVAARSWRRLQQRRLASVRWEPWKLASGRCDYAAPPFPPKFV